MRNGSGSAAVLALCLLGVAVQDTFCGPDQFACGGEKSKTLRRTGTVKRPVSPRAVVSKWIELVLAGKLRESSALTISASGEHAEHELSRLADPHSIRIERSLGNRSLAVVVTKGVKDVKSARQVAFAFWLVRREDYWLINTSYLDDSEDIEEQLRGLFMGGSVKWQVTDDDLVGTWEAGPGRPCGLGGVVCGSRLELQRNGTFVLEMWGPAGPGDENVVELGTWRLEGDLIVRAQDQRRLISRVSWIGDGFLILQSAAAKRRDGKLGTHYVRATAAQVP